MLELLNNFISSGSFIPHGHCYLWQKNLVSLHILSDLIISLSYYSIPTTLFYFVNKRKDLPFDWIFLLFSAFIIACGTTHILEIVTLWYPIYWVSGFAKALTAVVSLTTAVELVPLVPQALALPSPEQLKQTNQELQIQITERLRIESELRTYQNHLEELVKLRTQEISQTNEQLQQEITQRQHLLESLRQSEERYRCLIDVLPQLIWTTDTKGETDFFNKNWCEYTGLTVEQSLGSGWLNALHPEDVERSYQAWLNAVKTGNLYEIEYRFKRASDGAYRWLLGRGLPLKNEQGRIVKWIGSCTDIHEQKQIQQERDHLLELEQAAREKAETANKIKDEFLAVLSHELRTPLNSILGWARLLQMYEFDQNKITQALIAIERNAKLQAQLIEDLLDVSRILQGKFVLNNVNVNLRAVILPAIDTIKLAAETKSIDINAILPVNIGQVIGDPTRLQQVFWNLLSNAVKFTPKRGRVKVKLEQVDDYAQITVSDTGQGISAEFLPYVFDYFRQADSSSTRKFGGLGLGLAIVRNIVEIHGGVITASSPGVNQGAVFTVRLPLIKDDILLAMKEEKNPGLSFKDKSLLLDGLKVLVVDDDADSRDFIAFVLEQDGAEVKAVSSALEALKVLEQEPVDVLLSDISMPEIDGYTFIKQVRNWTAEQGGEIPAIALTAYAGEYDRSKATDAGFQLHVPKPVMPEDLVNAIARVVNVSQT
ncbi:MAG TPA: ATP-binding protein [Nostocaceae cyanobacterium]|nr:ATP-binding protein [Nostocaceae cyanobacterium]